MLPLWRPCIGSRYSIGNAQFDEKSSLKKNFGAGYDMLPFIGLRNWHTWDTLLFFWWHELLGDTTLESLGIIKKCHWPSKTKSLNPFCFIFIIFLTPELFCSFSFSLLNKISSSKLFWDKICDSRKTFKFSWKPPSLNSSYQQNDLSANTNISAALSHRTFIQHPRSPDQTGTNTQTASMTFNRSLQLTLLLPRGITFTYLLVVARELFSYRMNQLYTYSLLKRAETLKFLTWFLSKKSQIWIDWLNILKKVYLAIS